MTLRVEIAPWETHRPVLMEIRTTVFVVEQRVPEEEEEDGRDPEAQHFLAHLDGRAVGTARLRFVEPSLAKAERVAVLREVRGAGVGRALMEALEARARAQGAGTVRLAAQVHAMPFYERLGYTTWGDLFLDAGIEHFWMDKALA